MGAGVDCQMVLDLKMRKASGDKITLNPMLLPASLPFLIQLSNVSLPLSSCPHTVFFPQMIDSLLGLLQAHLLSDAHIAVRNDDYKDGLITWNKQISEYKVV